MPQIQGLQEQLEIAQAQIQRLSQQLVAERETTQRIQSQLQRQIEQQQQHFAHLEARDISYRHQFDCNPQPMWVYDLETLRFLVVNDAAIAKYGYSRDEFLTMTIADIRPSEDIERLLANVAQVTFGLDMAGIWRHCLRDGQIIWVEIASYAMEFEGRRAELVIAQDKTDRIEMEQALRRSKERYRVLVELAPQLMWSADATGLNTYVSKRMSEYIGLAPEQLMAFDWQEVIHPDDIKLVNERWMEAVQTKKPYELEYRMRRADGEYRWHLVQAIFVEYDSEIQWLGMTTDVHDRKQAQLQLQELNQELEQKVTARTAALAASEARLNLLLNSSPATIYSCQPHGDFACNFISSNVKKLMGYTSEEFCSQSEIWMQSLHPDDVARVLAEVPDLFEQDILKHDYRLRHRDGHYIWVHDELTLLRDEAGNPVEIVGFSADISDRKQAEIELQSLSNRLSLALKAGGFGIWDWDLLHDANWDRRMYEIYGLQNLGRAVTYEDWRDRVHPDDLELAETCLKRTVNGEEFVPEFRIRPDGELRWIQVFYHVLRDDDGKPECLVGINQDITERKAAETELIRANQELARATRLKDEFLANMSHELRTPLNAILGMTECMQDEVLGIVNERQLQALSLIESSGNHLLTLINDILDVAKTASGEMHLDYSFVAVEQLCNSSLAFVKQQAHKKQIHIAKEFAPHLPNLYIDEVRIRQVLLNLLTNAVKFTPAGGNVTLKASLINPASNTNQPTYLRFAIIDTGIGISPENISRLFQPFVQIDSALNRKQMGTGLGLALVKQMVELHGGQVGLTSELGVGSCFTIDLPYSSEVMMPVQPEAIASDLNSRQSSTSASTPSHLILLAEDNEANVMTISSYLETKGYRFIYACDGHEAIDLALTHNPSLILMDIQMPNMDGFEAITKIRQQDSLREVPIIALTARAMAGDRDRCLAVGANEYLSKPVKLKQLDTLIKEFLD